MRLTLSDRMRWFWQVLLRNRCQSVWDRYCCFHCFSMLVDVGWVATFWKTFGRMKIPTLRNGKWPSSLNSVSRSDVCHGKQWNSSSQKLYTTEECQSSTFTSAIRAVHQMMTEEWLLCVFCFARHMHVWWSETVEDPHRLHQLFPVVAHGNLNLDIH